MRLGDRLGPYEILALLGKGGMGEVYRARDSKLKREVAIKIVPDEFTLDTNRLSRFQREAEILVIILYPHFGPLNSCSPPAFVRSNFECTRLMS
jgi:eukaryotic-like serine/threonine-protein kinase